MNKNIKPLWMTIAPGVRACYRNGAVEIQCFGVMKGIKLVAPDGVNMDKKYLPEGETEVDQVERQTFFENTKGVLVNIVYFTERSKEEIEAAKKNSITEDDLDFLEKGDPENEADQVRAAEIQRRIAAQRTTLAAKTVSPNLDVQMFPTEWDSEVVLAAWRGEKGPRSPAEVAEMLAKMMTGEMTLDDLEYDEEDEEGKDGKDDSPESSGGPILH